jgi:cell filamentation protein
LREFLLVSKSNKLTDPYLYPNSSVLINKFGLKNQDALQEIEAFIFGLKNLESLPSGNFDYSHLKAIHNHFFRDVYEWAGKERTVDIAKGDSYFCHQQFITKELDKLFSKLKNDNYLRELSVGDFSKKLSFYFNEM